MLCEITRWKKLPARKRRWGETRGKNERIAMNDVCMHFVTRIIVDLSSCGQPRPSLSRQNFKLLFIKSERTQWQPRHDASGQNARTLAREHARFRDIQYRINAVRITAASFQKLNVAEELYVIYFQNIHKKAMMEMIHTHKSPRFFQSWSLCFSQYNFNKLRINFKNIYKSIYT